MRDTQYIKDLLHLNEKELNDLSEGIQSNHRIHEKSGVKLTKLYRVIELKKQRRKELEEELKELENEKLQDVTNDLV